MSSPSGRTTQEQDLEVKDPNIIFERVWSQMEQEYGRENLHFPKEIFWLNGSPGAGKGTNTRFIMKMRDLTAPPITVSELLKSPQAQKRMDSGLLVGDREVTELVFRSLIHPEYRLGAIVDGYPRTRVQVECLKLLYERLNELHREFYDRCKTLFPKCQFHIIVLFIDENESVKRQLNRGREMIIRNEKVRESGVGEIKEVRKTDLSKEAARGRYRTFKERTYHALQTLSEVFLYHYIDAQGTVSEVQERIVNELRYQSSLELDETTNLRLSNLPIASNISIHARQQLVNRLDSYERDNRGLFAMVVKDIEEYFMPIIQMHAISGMAMINSENDLYGHSLALPMLIDVFSERGYHAVVDLRKEEIPDSIDLATGKIQTRIKRIYRIRVNFGGSEIRRSR